MHLVLADDAITQFADQGRRAERDLVHAVLAPDHERVTGAELLEHAHEDADEVRVKDPEQDVRRARRVGQRAEDVEDRAHAHFAAHRRHRLHSRMVDRCEHEADADFLDAGRDLFRLQFDRRAERLEHVGAAGFRRHAAVAMLGHARPGRSHDEHRGR